MYSFHVYGIGWLFQLVLACNSFLVLHKCFFIPNFVFVILILLKNCKSFRPLKTCICPSVWFIVSVLTLSQAFLLCSFSHTHTGPELQSLSSPPGIQGCSLLFLLSHTWLWPHLAPWPPVKPTHLQSLKFQSTYKTVCVVQTLPYFQFILHIHIPWIALVHCILPCLSLLFLPSCAHPYCSFQISHVMYTPWILFFLFLAS